jgi:hypothetical protein
LEEIDKKEQDATLRVVDFHVVQERERNVVEEAAQADAAQECETRKRKVFVFNIHTTPFYRFQKFSRFYRLEQCRRLQVLQSAAFRVR